MEEKNLDLNHKIDGVIKKTNAQDKILKKILAQLSKKTLDPKCSTLEKKKNNPIKNK